MQCTHGSVLSVHGIQVRWQSNVHRESSLTVTLGPKAETTGPRGAADPVLHLTTYLLTYLLT